MAEWEGFEPSPPLTSAKPLAGAPLEPLGYHSVSSYKKYIFLHYAKLIYHIIFKLSKHI